MHVWQRSPKDSDEFPQGLFSREHGLQVRRGDGQDRRSRVYTYPRRRLAVCSRDNSSDKGDSERNRIIDYIHTYMTSITYISTQYAPVSTRSRTTGLRNMIRSMGVCHYRAIKHMYVCIYVCMYVCIQLVCRY